MGRVNGALLRFSRCGGAGELLRHNLISSDGISYESGNASEYEQRDERGHGP